MHIIKIVIKLISTILITLLMWSCENDIVRKEAVINPKLIMNAFINADSINNVLYLNMSASVVIGHIEEATVEVYVDNKLVETATEMPLQHILDNQKRYLITTKFNQGDHVRIQARTT